jgi:methyl-accepting chemotaxis protein
MQTSLTSFWTVRRKMLIPALAAMGATALSTGVTLLVSEGAKGKLEDVENRSFPELRFSQTMLNSLKEAQLLLLNVGEAESMDSIDIPDDLHGYVVQKVQTDGIKALGADRAKKLEAEFDDYYAAARTLAVKRVQAQLKAKRAIARASSDMHIYSDATPEERAIKADTSAVNNKYGDLYDRFTKEADQAGAEMTAALTEAKRVQRISIWAGAGVLLVSALLASLGAWLIAKRASRPLRTLSSIALRVAEGDLTQDVKVETKDEVGLLATSFQRMVGRLRELVGTLKTAAQELAVAAEQLSDHTRAQSAMLEQQASGVAETSSTTRELEQTSSVAASRAASVLEVAKRAAEMSDAGRDSAEKSAGELQRIQASVESIIGQSAGLLDQARQVGDIVETVRDLATQSHVLSLNASIEAAKAGEAGKSFGVVAQEVRALAEQSGESAARIGKIVEDILAAVQSTRDMTERGSKDMTGSLAQVRSSGESLREIGSIVRETSDAALQIASAVQQQSTGIGQIASAMRDLDKGMEETIGRIRSLEISAQQVAETATRISAVAAEFTV